MRVEIVSHSTDAERTISRGGGLCYGKDNSEAERIGRLKTSGHLAVLRHSSATFIVTDISIPAHTQFVRSPFLHFLVESARYVDKGDRVFIMPKVSNESQKEIEAFVEAARVLYRRLLADGVKKEDARAVLPANIATTLMVTGNFQAWIGFFKLRVSKHAQLEIRTIAYMIWSTLAVNFPLVFADLKFDDKGLAEWDNELREHMYE